MNNSTRVILIDDDPFILTMTESTVKSIMMDSEVQTFSSAKDALHYLAEEEDLPDGTTPDHGIILSDLHMPGMDGFQFIDQFTRLSLAVQSRYSVFILSATTDEKDRDRLFDQCSLSGFCPKPLTPQKFMDLMERTCCK